MKVKDQLKDFYIKNNLGKNGGTNKNWNKFKVGSYFFTLPNLNKKGFLLHDVNHLLSGYGIDWFGEYETAAWELGSGGRKGFGLSWFYPLSGFILGLIAIPKRTIRAYKAGLKRKNAHILSKDYELLEMELAQLNKISNKLGIR